MRDKFKLKREKRRRRHARVRGRVFGTKEKPRLSVFRSLKHIYAQLIDDEEGKTLVAASDLELKSFLDKAGRKRIKKIEIAKEVGKLIAKKALAKKINYVVFDRGGYKYHGRVKALAEGARENGLKF